jgi:hypothetical protein
MPGAFPEGCAAGMTPDMDIITDRSTPDAQRFLAALDRLKDRDVAGWAEYESRYETTFYRPAMRMFFNLKDVCGAEIFTGDNLVPGTRLCLCHEQGYGDFFQFIRYIPAFVDLWGRHFESIHLLPPLSMQPLLNIQPLLNGVSIITGDDMPRPHYVLGVCSLRHLVSAATTDFIGHSGQPYLRAPPLDRRFGTDQTGYIALAWYTSSLSKNIDLESVCHLIRRTFGYSGRVIALHHMVNEAEIEILDRHDVEYFSDLNVNGVFFDIAALIAHASVVITPDTSYAHLAGALGVSSRIFLHYGDWRWGHRPDLPPGTEMPTPWYDSARLISL